MDADLREQDSSPENNEDGDSSVAELEDGDESNNASPTSDAEAPAPAPPAGELVGADEAIVAALRTAATTWTVVPDGPMPWTGNIDTCHGIYAREVAHDAATAHRIKAVVRAVAVRLRGVYRCIERST